MWPGERKDPPLERWVPEAGASGNKLSLCLAYLPYLFPGWVLWLLLSFFFNLETLTELLHFYITAGYQGFSKRLPSGLCNGKYERLRSRVATLKDLTFEDEREMINIQEQRI